MKLIILCLALAGCALAMPVAEIKDESSPGVVAPTLPIATDNKPAADESKSDSTSEELAAPGEPAQPADAPKIAPADKEIASLAKEVPSDAEKKSDAALSESLVPKIDIVEASKTLAGVADEAVPPAFNSLIPVPQKKIDLPVNNEENVKTAPAEKSIETVIVEKSAEPSTAGSEIKSDASTATLISSAAEPAVPVPAAAIPAAIASADATPAGATENDDTVRKVRGTVDEKKEISEKVPKEEGKVETAEESIPEPAAQEKKEQSPVLKRETQKEDVNSEEDSSKSVEEPTADKTKQTGSHESVESSVEKVSEENDDDDDESGEKVKEKLTPLPAVDATKS